jgi:SH3 domain-containing YSC84-like protein 1
MIRSFCMSRTLVAAALALLLLAGLPSVAHAQNEQQALVDRATLTVQDMFAPQSASDQRSLLQRAKGALICPQIFKAGFILGGQGGDCVLVGRGASGWTAPAFYTIGSGSIGLQIGVQDSEVVFLVLTERGLHALLDSQFKVGADASIAVATLGAGVSGSTTAALRADIVAFAKVSGLFAGISLEGSLIGAKSGWNQSYYGRPMAAQQIVLQGEASNPGAAPLSETLARYAGG